MKPTATGSSKNVTPHKAHAAVKGAAMAHPSSPAWGDGRDEIIRQTAYSFNEARGRIDGHELEDWLKAEAQVEKTLARTVKAPASSGH
jgi:hypothetical protein